MAFKIDEFNWKPFGRRFILTYLVFFQSSLKILCRSNVQLLIFASENVYAVEMHK